MFGLLKRIRDKSDSDIAEVEKQLSAELQQIQQFESRAATRVDQGLAGRRVVNRIQRDRELTTDSDGNSGYTPPPQRTVSHSPTAPLNSRALPPNYIPVDLQHRRQHVPMFSDEELQKAHENRDRLIDDSHLDAIFPFSILQNDPVMRNGAVPVEEGVLKNQKLTQMGGATTKYDIRAQLSSLDVSASLPESGQAQLLVKEHNVHKQATQDQSVNKQLNRLKLVVFKLRLRTDKALYHHFAKKVIANRRKVQKLKEKQLELQKQQQMEQFQQEKAQLVAFLDGKGQDIPGNSLMNQKTRNLTPDGLDGDLNDIHDEMDDRFDGDPIDNQNNQNSPGNQQDDEDYEQDLMNVVTRVEMDNYVSAESLRDQKQCHYCLYRPLHLFTLSTNSPMIYTTEDGSYHFQAITKKFQRELSKGGEFIQNVEKALFALKFGLPILPYRSQYLNQYENSEKAKEKDEIDHNSTGGGVQSFSTVKQIQDYLTFTHQHKLSLQPTLNESLLNSQQYAAPDSFIQFAQSQDPQKQQNRAQIPLEMCVQLSNDWFLIEPRSKTSSTSSRSKYKKSNSPQNSPSEHNNEGLIRTNVTHPAYSKISTHNGVTVYCKDMYALNSICNLALFHSCYAAVQELKTPNLQSVERNEKGDKTAYYPYKIDLWFNTGCCLCHNVGEIDAINALGKEGQNSTNTTNNSTLFAKFVQNPPSHSHSHSQPESLDSPPSDTAESIDTSVTGLDSIDFDSIDESSNDDFIIGLLRDSLGYTVEQYTYCLPHIKSVLDIAHQDE